MTNLNDKEHRQIVKALAKMAYPDYQGRLFKVVERKSYHMQDYWDEGSRYYCCAVDLKTGQIIPPSSSPNQSLKMNDKPFTVFTITISPHTCP